MVSDGKLEEAKVVSGDLGRISKLLTVLHPSERVSIEQDAEYVDPATIRPPPEKVKLP